MNVNREILNKSHSPKRQKERVVKEKLESDLVVKNDFSAWLFIEELSFEGRKREQEGKKEICRLLHGTWKQGRVIRSNGRQKQNMKEQRKDKLKSLSD